MQCSKKCFVPALQFLRKSLISKYWPRQKALVPRHREDHNECNAEPEHVGLPTTQGCVGTKVYQSIILSRATEPRAKILVILVIHITSSTSSFLKPSKVKLRLSPSCNQSIRTSRFRSTELTMWKSIRTSFAASFFEDLSVFMFHFILYFSVTFLFSLARRFFF